MLCVSDAGRGEEHREGPTWHEGTTRHPPTHPPPASPCPTARLFPARASVEPSSISSSRCPQREGQGQTLWSLGGGWGGALGMAEVTEGVASCCRSVPRAWWMKTPSNSFTHSSSLREVSLRPVPLALPNPPRPPSMAPLQTVGVTFKGEGILASTLCLQPGAASVLLERWGTPAPEWQHTPALALALPRCHHLCTLPLQRLRRRWEWGHPL